MTSNDKQAFLTKEVFEAKMDAFMATIRLENEKLRSQLHSEIKVVESEVRVNSAQISDLQHSVYWGFAILGIIITLAIFFKSEKTEKKEKKTYATVEQVQEIVKQTKGVIQKCKATLRNKTEAYSR